MFRIKLDYSFTHDGSGAAPHLDNALFTLLRAIRESGSISQSAKTLRRSYRHVWGELKRWEGALGHTLIEWVKGRRARLSPFGEKLLWAEERARARIGPQVQSLAAEMERAFAVAFDEHTHVLPVCASHDLALPLLRDDLATQGVHLDLRYAGSLDALAALTAGRALLAGFHVNDDHPAGSLTARAFKRALTPGTHKLIDFARRRQGLIVPAGNPQQLASLADLARGAERAALRGAVGSPAHGAACGDPASAGSAVRFINRQRGAGTRIEFDQLLAAAQIDPAAINGYGNEETTHLAVAAAVAAGAADAGFGIEAAALHYRLGFVPLAGEHYYLVCLKETLQHPAVKLLTAHLESAAWRRRMATLPGYTLDAPGNIVALTRALPWYRWRRAKG